MRFRIHLAAALAGVAALASATQAAAAFPTLYTDEAAFLTQGTILQSTDFDALGPGLTYLNPTESYGALTLAGAPLIVIGPGSNPDPVRNLITNFQIDEDLNGTINQAGANMLGFQMGNLTGFGEQVFVELFTNLDSYAYGLYPTNGTEDLSFYGFVVPLGEYFVGFEMNATSQGQIYGLTDIALGTTASVCDTRICEPGGAVPEPATWAMMILGFGMSGAILRARRRPVGASA